MLDTLTLDRPLDMHIHFRDGEILRHVVPWTANAFVGAVAMPNLVPPVDELDRLLAYKQEIRDAAGDQVFEPLVPLFFKPFDRETLTAAKPHIIGLKLYPEGATTNSDEGVKELDDAMETIALAEELDIPLLVHGETGGFVLDREAEYVKVYDHVATTFPKLRLIMEHITTAAAADFLDRHENVFATITLHHLWYTLDDLMGGMLNPHLFCKPVVKTPRDRDAIRALAFRPHPKVMFGTDSAPHPRERKEAAQGAAGCFSAPAALPMLAELFEQHDALASLQAFVSDHARRIYRLDPPAKTVTLERREWRLPEACGPVTPMDAGRVVPWCVVD